MIEANVSADVTLRRALSSGGSDQSFPQALPSFSSFHLHASTIIYNGTQLRSWPSMQT
jgi:hypothetical protein